MSVFKRSVRSVFIFMVVGLTTSCSVTEAAQTPSPGSSDQSHVNHDNFLKAHDAKLGDKSTPGSLIGFVFGLTQQMRGAHFFSHDLATILVSVFCSLFTVLIFNSVYCKTNEIKILKNS